MPAERSSDEPTSSTGFTATKTSPATSHWATTIRSPPHRSDARGRARTCSCRSSSATSPTRRAARARASRSSCRSPSVRSTSSGGPASDTVMRYLRESGDGESLLRLHPGPLPTDDDEARGAGPGHVEPRAHGDADAQGDPACVSARRGHRTIANYEEKLGVIAERYLDHDVRAVAGTTCWFTLLFEKVLAAASAAAATSRTVARDLAEPARPLRGRRRLPRPICPSSGVCSAATT